MQKKLAWTLLAIAISSSPAWAQSTFGTIVGTVSDETGAVIPNASVKIINIDENTARTVSTDAGGDYDAVDLKAGHYAVEASISGFKTTRVGDLELEARQTLRVNVTLAVGEMTQ